MKFATGQVVTIFLKGTWTIAGPRDTQHRSTPYTVLPADDLARSEADRWRKLRGWGPERPITCSAKFIRPIQSDPFNRS